MPSITIDYTENEGKIPVKTANDQGKTAKEYIESLLQSHCAGQIQGFFRDKVKDLTIDELIALLGDIE